MPETSEVAFAFDAAALLRDELAEHRQLFKVVGADLVQKRGGRVFLAPLLRGHSTTNTLKRVSTPRRGAAAAGS